MSISIKPKCDLKTWLELSKELEDAGLNPNDFVECSQCGLLLFHLVQNKLGGAKSKREIKKENYL